MNRALLLLLSGALVFADAAETCVNDYDSDCLLQTRLATQLEQKAQAMSPSAPEGMRKLSSLSEHSARSLDPAHAASFGNSSTKYVAEGGETHRPKNPADIWNQARPWKAFIFWHPRRVVSKVNDGQVHWSHHEYLNLGRVTLLSTVAYPVIPIAISLLFLVIVSCWISVDRPSLHETAPPFEGIAGEASHEEDTKMPQVGFFPESRLTPMSQNVYHVWKVYSCCLPALLLFGTPLFLVAQSYWHPQEVYVILMVFCSIYAFSSGAYTAVFSYVSISRMCDEMLTVDEVFKGRPGNPHCEKVRHWVFFPNYQEDIDIMENSIDSVARSSLAKTQIGLVLAMEAREVDAQAKANRLYAKFVNKFLNIQICFHPKDLPQDPPGKASNMAYAFKFLQSKLESAGEDVANVILTVADADSEFHESYFEALSRQFVETAHAETAIWQGIVLHIKNYHRQPSPIMVGTLTTSMLESSVLGDPNAVRFPYSTYSLSFNLVKNVGGWDPEWIAEDWHMGMKCFLLTLAQSRVHPIFLPIVNYTPEEGTWFGDIAARWSQAKRHALGITDLSYFFMVLPLLFLKIVQSSQSTGDKMCSFWRMAALGICYLSRFVSTHVILASMVLYTFYDTLLRLVMRGVLSEFRGVNYLIEHTMFFYSFAGAVAFAFSAFVTLNYLIIYQTLGCRLDSPTVWKWMYRYRSIHWIFTIFVLFIWGFPYMVGYVMTTWIAAIKCTRMWTTTSGFEFEVALKPKPVMKNEPEQAVFHEE